MEKITSITRKKVPMRKCVITNTILPKRELIRIVVSEDGTLLIDKSGKHTGRGAYIQPKLVLIPHLKKNQSLVRALKTKIANEFYDEIIKEIEENWD